MKRTDDLVKMMGDKDWKVREEVAKRIDIKYLPQMMEDEYWYVRLEVAERIELKYLSQMMGDENWYVRKVAAKRQTKETAILGELLWSAVACNRFGSK